MRIGALMTAACLGTLLAATALARPAGGVGGAVGDEMTFKYKWTKGQVLHYRLTSESKQKSSGGGNERETTNTLVVTERWEVADVAADGAATVKVTFEKVKVDADEPPAGKISYDSSNPETETAATKPAAMGGAALAGETVTMVILPDGSVKSVEGMSKVADKIGKGSPQDMRVQSLKANYSDDAMRQQRELLLKALPEKPVKPGDTWTRTSTVPLARMGKAAASATTTFKGIDKVDGRQVARIVTAMTIDLAKPKEGEEVDAMMAMLKMEMKDGKGDGEVLFDVDDGQPRKIAVAMAMPITMEMPQQGQMSIRIDSKRSLERTEDTGKK